MSSEDLQLKNQVCFPLYAASRLVIRLYQPYLSRFDITYPQYLVLLVLWEQDGQTVNDIAEKLILNTNTLTPLLKRMETQQLIVRQRDASDERKVLVQLAEKGRELEKEAMEIPQQMAQCVLGNEITMEKLMSLKTSLQELIVHLK